MTKPFAGLFCANLPLGALALGVLVLGCLGCLGSASETPWPPEPPDVDLGPSGELELSKQPRKAAEPASSAEPAKAKPAPSGALSSTPRTP